MAGSRARWVSGASVIVAALAYLATAAMRSNWIYYQDVDSYVLSAPTANVRARLHGRVSQEIIDLRPAELTARFRLEGQSQSITVVYRGVVPDKLVGGAEVVVEGHPDNSGVFLADTLLTKCTTKYQSCPSPQKGGEAKP